MTASGARAFNLVSFASSVSSPIFQKPRSSSWRSAGPLVVAAESEVGSEVGSDKYKYKLLWLSALYRFIKAEMQEHNKLVVLGDFNIAPADADVHDPKKWGEAILCSPLERKALSDLLDLGLTDVFRKFEHPEKTFSWWDYRAAGFRRNAGLRIDLILTTDSMTEGCTASYIDKEPRAWERPSDHTPVVAEFDY